MFNPFVASGLPLALFMSLVGGSAIGYAHADAPIAETADAVRPLAVGDAAPRFTVRTVEGETFDFDPRRLERPTLLISFRGGWCPYCNFHLSELRHVLPRIRAMNIDVLFLSGDRPELLYKSLSAETQGDIAGLGYTILSDADTEAAVALGIAFRAPARYRQVLPARGRDIAESSIARHGILPVPAVFAVDRRGTIAYAFVDADYTVRLPADELLTVAAALEGRTALKSDDAAG